MKPTNDTTKHPIQPIVFDEDNVARFKENKIVRFLLNAGPFDMNKLADLPFPKDDRQHFAQLIGYSIDGFGEISYAPPDLVTISDAKVEKILNDN